MSSRIGLDLDGVFINHPPFIPKFIIEKLYKRRGNGILYRSPGKLEQKLRVLSHAPIFRPAIKNNLSSFKKAHLDNIYLISSRFSFLADRTRQWDKANDLFRYFAKKYFNHKDEQPHKFKDRIIKKEKIDKFVDDDLELLQYLARENPNVNFFWLTKSSSKIRLPSNIQKVSDLNDFFLNYV